MYLLRNGTKYKSEDGIIRTIDYDGYVRLKGVQMRQHPKWKETYGRIACGVLWMRRCIQCEITQEERYS